MKARSQLRKDLRRAAGFTLVELMVVIAIIGLLVAFLLPAIGQVSKHAREVGSRATLASIDAGLQSFRAEGMAGSNYPPSFSDATGSDKGTVASPYQRLDGSPITHRIRMTGAGLLVWALAGADKLGTPGFKPFRENETLWSNDTDDINNGTPATSGAYAIDNDGVAVHSRSGPYVEMSKIKTSEWDGTKFAIPAEKTAGNANPEREYPMFLDGFGFPILYWRADAAGNRCADRDRNNNGVNRGIYHYTDNAPLIDARDYTDTVVEVQTGARNHRLEYLGGMGGGNPESWDAAPGLGTFKRYIMDESIKAKLAPQRPDSYLLVTPGADGLYGTADDITNFAPNAR